MESKIKLISVHVDATDHGQTTRAILRNEALYHEVDTNRLLILITKKVWSYECLH